MPPGLAGWAGYADGPGGTDHLRPGTRAAAGRREAERSERRGRLLCEVHIRVYERDTGDDEMDVRFPPDAVLGPDTDAAEVAAVVARARNALAGWR